MRISLSLLFVAVLAAGCTSDLAQKRELYLNEVTTHVVTPQLQAVATTFGALKTAIDALAAAQSAWRAARTEWKRSEVLLLGKTMAGDIRPSVDWFPIDATKLEGSIAGSATLDVAFVQASGSSQKGFLALEYFLFDAMAPNQVLVRLTTDSLAARRRQYVSVLAADLDAYGKAFQSRWTESFAAAFTQANVNHSEYANPREAIGDVINRLVYMSEKIAEMKLARPLGLLTGTGVDPTLEEAPRSDNSRADALDSLAGARALYYSQYDGTTSYSLSDLVKIAGAPIDGRVGKAFDDANAALTAIPTPFHATLTTDASTIVAAESKLRALRTVLATEVAANQGATIGFSDNDGD